MVTFMHIHRDRKSIIILYMLHHLIMFGCINVSLYDCFLADNVPMLMPTEVPHRVDLPSVDPLTTKNSAYDLGKENLMTTTDN